jgi:hypothetical protein
MGRLSGFSLSRFHPQRTSWLGSLLDLSGSTTRLCHPLQATATGLRRSVWCRFCCIGSPACSGFGPQFVFQTKRTGLGKWAGPVNRARPTATQQASLNCPEKPAIFIAKPQGTLGTNPSRTRDVLGNRFHFSGRSARTGGRQTCFKPSRFTRINPNPSHLPIL